MNEIVLAYLRYQLNYPNLLFGRIDWIWTNGLNLTLDVDKGNAIDGILIFNFGITMDGSGAVLTLTDLQSTKVVYQNLNQVKESIVAPFVYFTQATTLKFSSSIATTFGFNYVTVLKEENK